MSRETIAPPQAIHLGLRSQRPYRYQPEENNTLESSHWLSACAAFTTYHYQQEQDYFRPLLLRQVSYLAQAIKDQGPVNRHRTDLITRSKHRSAPQGHRAHVLHV